MDVWMGINALVNVINLGLLALLVVIYVKIYVSSKTHFTLGLMFFSGLLMVNSIIAIYSYFTMAQLFSEILSPYLLAISVAELAGLSILLRITLV